MFFYTGYIKIESPLQFAVTLLGYELFPEALIPLIAQWFPWAEIVLGVFLLIGWKMRYVAAATSALLLTFTVVLTITYLRGIEANCGCFNFDDKITPLTILRDGVILLPALYLLFEDWILARWKSVIPEESGKSENSQWDKDESDVS